MTWVRLAVVQPILADRIPMPLHKKSEPLVASVGRFILWNGQPPAQFFANLMDFLPQRTLYRIRESFPASNSTDIRRINSEFLCDSYIQPAV
jgi:hypothetical protein